MHKARFGVSVRHRVNIIISKEAHLANLYGNYNLSYFHGQTLTDGIKLLCDIGMNTIRKILSWIL